MNEARLTATSPDGVVVSATVTNPGVTDQPPLLLVHGTSGDAARWTPVLGGLSARRTVYALDRRGRGGSGDGDGPYAISLEFEDVRAMAAAVAETHAGALDLLGHSYGGICSLEAVALGIPALRRFVLYEPPVPTGSAFIDMDMVEEMKGWAAAGDRERIVETFILHQVHAPQAELDMMRIDPSWANRVAAAHTIPRELSEVGGGYNPNKAGISAISAPTRLLLGSESTAYQVAATTWLSETIPGAELVVLDGHAHNVMNTGPELFIRQVLEFLDG